MGDFYQHSSKSWQSIAHAGFAGRVNRTLVVDSLLQLLDLSRGNTKVPSLLYGILINKAHKQNVPVEGMLQMADQWHFLALLVH